VGIGKDALRKSGCPVWQCETSDDRHNVEEYDAIVFHLRSWTQKDLPQRRSPQQRYVFWSIESAAWRFVDTKPMTNYFNWTMTYRWDSDLVSPYGYIKPTGNVPLHPSHEQMKDYLTSRSVVNYAEGKTKMAAWFVSNCASKSRRMELVKELQKYIDVDVYGDCGTMKCPRKREEDCRQMAANKYKFYLSLENSICQDYVTEK
jgi:alpha-1,3-fucosyltransferase